jgi:pyrroloquinoline quinone biosynthesis protein D
LPDPIDNKDLFMSINDEKQHVLTADMRPNLVFKARLQIDKATGEPVLLYPEGLLQLNGTGAAIIQLCDGQRTFSEMLAELAGHYQVASQEALTAEVSVFLIRLHNLALLEFSQ